MNGLTTRQRLVLATLERLTDRKGYPPTTREMCCELGIGSTEGVMCHIRVLEKKGYVTRQPREARSIVSTRRGIPLLNLEDIERAMEA